MTNALVSSLIQQGDASIQEEKDLKNDAAANAVARLFSLVNAGKLDVSVLDQLIAFADNPTSLAGPRALGSGNTASATPDEQGAIDTLMATDKLPDNIKKGLRKLLEGKLVVDSEGNPVATSAADPNKLKDLEDQNKKMRDGYAELGATFKGIGVVGNDYTKFAKDIADRHQETVKKESDKATKATEDKFKDSLPKTDVKQAAEDILAWLHQAKKPSLRTGNLWGLTQDDHNGLQSRAEDLKKSAS